MNHSNQPAHRSNAALIAAGFILTFWSSPGQTFFISLFGDELRSLLDINHTQFGAMYSLATLASAVLLLWTGNLVDKLPLPKLVACVVAGLAASLLFLSTVQNFIMVFIGLFLLRHIGQGLMMLIASSSIVRYLDNIRGRGTALSGLGYTCAEATLPAIVIWLSISYGWRSALMTSGVALMLFMLPLLLFLLRGHNERHRRYLNSLNEPASDQHSGNKVSPTQLTTQHWTRKEVLRDRNFYCVLPALTAHPILFTGFIFHQLVVIEQKGWPIELWAKLFTVYAICGIIARLLTGIAIDRYSATRIILLPLVSLSLGISILAFSSDTYSAWGFMIFLGITTGMQSTVGAPFWVEMYGSKYIGSIKSVTTFAILGGTAISPVGMGWLIDSGTSINAIAAWSVAYVTLALGLGLFALRSHR